MKQVLCVKCFIISLLLCIIPTGAKAIVVFDFYGNAISYEIVDGVGTCMGPFWGTYIENTNEGEIVYDIDESVLETIETVGLAYSIDFGDWWGYVPITRINDFAFSACSNLKSIDIAGVTEIGSYAFCGQEYNMLEEEEESEGLTGFSFINLEWVRVIGDYAFAGCSGLQSANLSSLEGIGEGAFEGCTSLGSVTLPEFGLWGFPKYTFRNCKSLGSLTLPRTFTFIGDYAFQGCENLSQIMALEDISLESIGKYAFEGCSSLDNMAMMGRPRSVGEGAFKDCTALTFASVLQVEDLGESAFMNCLALTGVALPSDLPVVPADCFSGCSSLESITIPESVKSINGGAFAQTGLKSIELPEGLHTIGMDAFYECNNLSVVNFPRSLEKIYDYAFYCTAVEKLDLPEGLQGIGQSAFFGCRKLESVTFREGLEEIYPLAFGSDVALKEIVLPKSLNRIGGHAFSYCTGLEKVECKSTEPPVWFGSYTFQEGQNPLFNGIPDLPGIPLYVPAGCKAKYLASDIWKDFNIVERSSFVVPTGVDSAQEDAMQAEGGVYDLQGHLVGTSDDVKRSGIYVRNGKKVVIK